MLWCCCASASCVDSHPRQALLAVLRLAREQLEGSQDWNWTHIGLCSFAWFWHVTSSIWLFSRTPCILKQIWTNENGKILMENKACVHAAVFRQIFKVIKNIATLWYKPKKPSTIPKIVRLKGKRIYWVLGMYFVFFSHNNLHLIVVKYKSNPQSPSQWICWL